MVFAPAMHGCQRERWCYAGQRWRITPTGNAQIIPENACTVPECGLGVPERSGVLFSGLQVPYNWKSGEAGGRGCVLPITRMHGRCLARGGVAVGTDSTVRPEVKLCRCRAVGKSVLECQMGGRGCMEQVAPRATWWDRYGQAHMGRSPAHAL